MFLVGSVVLTTWGGCMDGLRSFLRLLSLLRPSLQTFCVLSGCERLWLLESLLSLCPYLGTTRSAFCLLPESLWSSLLLLSPGAELMAWRLVLLLLCFVGLQLRAPLEWLLFFTLLLEPLPSLVLRLPDLLLVRLAASLLPFKLGLCRLLLLLLDVFCLLLDAFSWLGTPLLRPAVASSADNCVPSGAAIVAYIPTRECRESKQFVWKHQFFLLGGALSVIQCRQHCTAEMARNGCAQAV